MTPEILSRTMAPPNSDVLSLKERLGRLSQEELLQQCKMMLTEITEGITATAATATATAIGSCHGYDDNDGSCNSSSTEYNLLETTTKLFDALSDKDKRNHTETLAACKNSNNRNYDTNRKRLRADDGATFMKKTLQFPPSIIINHVLPYLDHETWKSVSILSKGIHCTINEMKLFPPWPTMRGITVNFNMNGVQEDREQRNLFNFSFAFDHTDGSRLVAWNRLNPSKNHGLIFDSKRGLIKEINFDLIIERERAPNKIKPKVHELYLLDRKTLLVKLQNWEGAHSLYMYRLVEDDSSPRNAVGFDMIRHSTIAETDGPWIFKRNGILYVATAQGWIETTVENGAKKSETIVIHQYLGETIWPRCLRETHRLQYPVIDFDDDDEDGEEYCWGEVFKYIGQTVKDNQCSTTDERIVFVSVTNKGNLHVHCWCVTFDHQIFGIGSSDGKQSPCISFGKTPYLQLGFLDYKKIEDLYVKITPWPNNKDNNNNYLFRIIQYIPAWWSNYEEDVDSFNEHRAFQPPRFYTIEDFEDLIGTYNMGNIFVSDYNILTNKFDDTKNLSLKNRDQSVLQYNGVFASHDGRHLLTQPERGNYFGIYRIDALGCSIVKNFEFKSITGEIDDDYFWKMFLSNNNKMIGIPIFGGRDSPDRFHIDYLYLK